MLQLFLKKYARIIKFLLVGASGVIVNLGLLYILKEFLKIHYLVAGLIAIECSIINNFILNSIWTWKDRFIPSLKVYLYRLIKFNISTGLSILLINFCFLWLLTEYFNVYYLISQSIGILMGTILNFLLYHYWVFK